MGFLVAPAPATAQRGRTDAGERVERKSERKVERKTKAPARERAKAPVRAEAPRQAKRGDDRRADRRADNRADRRVDRRRDDRRVDNRRVDRRPGRVYVAPKYGYAKVQPHVYVRRPRVDIHVNFWPWETRYVRHWAPRYTHRHVVIVHSRDRSRRAERIEYEANYRHRVLWADDRKAVLDIEIESIAVYSDGRYVGSVHDIPLELSRVEATVYRDGDMTFDTDLYLLGDRRRGFEIVNAWTGEAGRLDFRRERVREIGRSRLYRPDASTGYVPFSLLPEGHDWLWNEGVDAMR
ncbi:MAG: hypothetical protein RIE53_11135 [Rhodothermales bacterium]